jgi:hypothetical protein
MAFDDFAIYFLGFSVHISRHLIVGEVLGRGGRGFESPQQLRHTFAARKLLPALAAFRQVSIES